MPNGTVPAVVHNMAVERGDPAPAPSGRPLVGAADARPGVATSRADANSGLALFQPWALSVPPLPLLLCCCRCLEARAISAAARMSSLPTTNPVPAAVETAAAAVRLSAATFSPPFAPTAPLLAAAMLARMARGSAVAPAPPRVMSRMSTPGSSACSPSSHVRSSSSLLHTRSRVEYSAARAEDGRPSRGGSPLL